MQPVTTASVLPDAVVECPVCAVPQAPNAKFCAYCGQRHRYGRLTLHSVFSDFFHQLTNFDKGFGRNLRMIFTAPGEMFRDLIARRNGRYQNILRFTLIVTTLSVLAYQFFGVYEAQIDSLTGPAREEVHGAGEIDMEKVIREVTSKYMSLLYFLSIPFTALINRLLYWKKPFNLAEHVVLAAIQACGGMLIILLSDILNFKILGANYWVLTIGYLVYAIYLSYCLRAALGGSWLGAFFKALLSLIFAFTTVTLLVVLLIPIGLSLIEWWSGPEAIEAMLARFRYD